MKTMFVLFVNGQAVLFGHSFYGVQLRAMMDKRYANHAYEVREYNGLASASRDGLGNLWKFFQA